MISIASVFRTGKNYFPQVFLEECKYVVKEKKIHNYFIGDVEVPSDEENSDKENSGEEDSSEKDSSEEDSDEKN